MRVTAVGSRCGQNLKYETFTSSSGTLHQKIAPKGVRHVQHDYFFLIHPIKALNCWVVIHIIVS